MFGTLENLHSFVSLRLKYLITILREVLPKVIINDVGSHEMKDALVQIASLSFEGPEFETLVIFDSIQFAQTWAREWADLLLKARNVEHLAKLVRAMPTVVAAGGGGTDAPEQSELGQPSQGSRREGLLPSSRLTPKTFKVVGGADPDNGSDAKPAAGAKTSLDGVDGHGLEQGHDKWGGCGVGSNCSD